MEAQYKTNQKFKIVLTQVVQKNKEIKSHNTKLTNALTIQERVKFLSLPQSNLEDQDMTQPLLMMHTMLKRPMLSQLEVVKF